MITKQKILNSIGHLNLNRDITIGQYLNNIVTANTVTFTLNDLRHLLTSHGYLTGNYYNLVKYNLNASYINLPDNEEVTSYSIDEILAKL